MKQITGADISQQLGTAIDLYGRYKNSPLGEYYRGSIDAYLSLLDITGETEFEIQYSQSLRRLVRSLT